MATNKTDVSNLFYTDFKTLGERPGAMEATTPGWDPSGLFLALEVSVYSTSLQGIIQLSTSLKCLSAVIQTILFTPAIPL